MLFCNCRDCKVFFNIFKNIFSYCDAPKAWGVYFQDSASPQMEAVRRLIAIMPVSLNTMTISGSYKPTSLPLSETRGGPEHASEGWNMISYKLYKAKVISDYVLITCQSQHIWLNSEVDNTNNEENIIKVFRMILDISSSTYTTSIMVKAKVWISDVIVRIRDLLTWVISILGLETRTRKEGDGATVVLNEEGLQDWIINTGRTGALTHSSWKLRTSVSYCYRRPAHIRNISSIALKNLELYKKVYDEVKSRPGYMTPGVDKTTLDSMSNTKLEKLRDEVISWKYKCNPARRIYIPKSNGKMRPLGIPSTNDKILQMVLKAIIEPSCEKIFHDKSFGFRPHRSIHDALLSVRGMIGTSWMIEGDIKGFFDNVDHQIMMDIIKKRLNPDRTLSGLLWKFFKAGYMTEGEYRHSILGMPQGGVLSPLLSNLYLTLLDEFVDGLKKEYDSDKTWMEDPEHKKLRAKLQRLRSKLDNINSQSEEEIKELRQKIKELRRKTRSMSTTLRMGNKLYYVRYADDWVIGVIGNYQFASMIKEKVKAFLAKELKLELSEEKTKITNLGSEHARFLGHNIRCVTSKQTLATRIDYGKRVSRISKGKPKILVPKDYIRNKLKAAGMLNDKGKPKFIGKFIYLDDYEIVTRYNSIIRGFMNFYNLAENRHELVELAYIIEFSLAHTLAAKHRLTVKEVMNKYGRPITVKVKDSKGEVIKEVTFDKPTSFTAAYLNVKYSRHFKRKNINIVFDPLEPVLYKGKPKNILDQPCLICGTEENVEMHHVRRLKDTKDKSNLIKVMSRMRRKVIPLCMSCHDKVHAGKYDGLNLSEIRGMLN